MNVSKVRIIIWIEIIYLLIATFFIPTLPSWKMFSAVYKPQTFIMTDSQGTNIDLRHYLPQTYWFVDESTLGDIARFVCRKQNRAHTWSLTTKSGVYELSENQCILKKK